MPFKSKKQRQWMHANEPEMAKKWEKKEKMKKETKVKSLIKKMVREIMDEEKLTEKTKRDYKDEYKKFQSSDKSKKYRAELNKYNRDKGTYGNGDGKDASHKGGKIVGFEKESVNRGRAEKSRLKKKTSENVDMNEQKLREMIREVLNEAKLNEANYVIQYKKDKNRFLSNKSRDVKKVKDALQFKNTLDALRTLNGLDWQFRNNYKVVQVESINEATGKEKVFVQSGELWISHSTGSGRTTRLRGRGYFTDLKGNKNYDSDAKEFAIWATKNKPIKKKKSSTGSIVTLFKIPEYGRGVDAKDLSIWGGEVKPNKWNYMVVSSGKINVIMVFDNKPEAMSWIGHTAEGVNESKLNEANASQVRKELLKKFGKDPLYKDVIMAKNTKELKKAMDTLKSIRGGNAIVLMQKYANKLMGVDDKTANQAGNYKSMYRKITGESINEKISKEEWAQYPKYARKLKPYMQKLLKVKLRVGVTKQANHNPFINIRVANFGKDIIPNDFRVKVAKSIGASGVRNWDNVHYGNIQSNSVSLRYDQWVKLTGDLK